MMLERICFSVLESSLVASVLYALMMLGEGRLAKYSPRCRSTLWFILSARLLVPLPVGIVYFGDSFAQAKWQLLGRVWLAGMPPSVSAFLRSWAVMFRFRWLSSS